MDIKDITTKKAIAVFNSRINELMLESLNNDVLRVIKEKEEKRLGMGWHTILDSISPDYGFNFGYVGRFGKGDKIIGYRPFITFYNQDFNFDITRFKSLPLFSKKDECFNYLAEEVISLMITIKQSNS